MQHVVAAAACFQIETLGVSATASLRFEMAAYLQGGATAYSGSFEEQPPDYPTDSKYWGQDFRQTASPWTSLLLATWQAKLQFRREAANVGPSDRHQFASPCHRPQSYRKGRVHRQSEP